MHVGFLYDRCDVYLRLINNKVVYMIKANGEFLGHPKGLYVCFATEMWERFSFYGMKYLLLLYLTKYHLFSDADGLDVLGAYAGLVYALPVVGGLIADRYLGMRRAVIFGGILLCIGHFLMAVEGQKAVYYAAGTLLTDDLQLANGQLLLAGTLLETAVTKQDTAALNVFYLALTFIVAGVGFLKPNISVIVGKLYPENDPRRDSGFTLFYMGINVGSLIATLVCGWLGETYGWKYGFGLAGIGMVVGIFTFLWGQPYLKGFAESPCPDWLNSRALGFKREWLIYLATFPVMGVIWWLVQSEPVVHITQNIFLLIGIVGILAFSMIYPATFSQRQSVSLFAGAVILLGVCSIFAHNGVINLSPAMAEAILYASIILLLLFVIYGFVRHRSIEFTRTLVLMVLIISTVVFWSLFEQSAGSMTLYADRVLDREIGGFTFVASQVASLNPAFIMLFAIPFAILWPWLEARGWNPGTSVKFALGIIQAGLGFGALVLGAQFPDDSGKVAAIWMVLAYLFHSTGELCLSPIGLSAVSKLSIPRVLGVSMGTWFVATALSETLATRLSKLAAIDTAGAVDPLQVLATYTQLYEFLMWVGIGFGIFMLLISPLLKKGMGGIR
jgi:proton-dependent oligopeptide transporter, POT family